MSDRILFRKPIFLNITNNYSKIMKRLNLPTERTFVGSALVWKRIVAFFIDMLIITLFILFPFRRLFEDIIPKTYSFTEAYRFLISAENASYTVIVYLAASILMFLYFYILERRMGQSIGKKIMGIYVTSDANKVKGWQYLVRNLFLISIFPFDLLIIVDPLFMLFHKNSQRLSEILSNTKVVEIYKLDE